MGVMCSIVNYRYNAAINGYKRVSYDYRLEPRHVNNNV